MRTRWVVRCHEAPMYGFHGHNAWHGRGANDSLAKLSMLTRAIWRAVADAANAQAAELGAWYSRTAPTWSNTTVRWTIGSDSIIGPVPPAREVGSNSASQAVAARCAKLRWAHALTASMTAEAGGRYSSVGDCTQLRRWVPVGPGNTITVLGLATET